MKSTDLSDVVLNKKSKLITTEKNDSSMGSSINESAKIYFKLFPTQKLFKQRIAKKKSMEAAPKTDDDGYEMHDSIHQNHDQNKLEENQKTSYRINGINAVQWKLRIPYHQMNRLIKHLISFPTNSRTHQKLIQSFSLAKRRCVWKMRVDKENWFVKKLDK